MSSRAGRCARGGRYWAGRTAQDYWGLDREDGREYRLGPQARREVLQRVVLSRWGLVAVAVGRGLEDFLYSRRLEAHRAAGADLEGRLEGGV